MTIKSALSRIIWRVQGNGWNANQNDQEAINTIIDFVNNKSKKQINDNQLFAKLFVYVYSNFLEYYKTTVFDKTPEKELHKILEKPLTQIIEDLKEQLNTSEMYEIKKELGLSTKHPATQTANDKAKDSNIMEFLNNDQVVSLMSDVWTYEDVESNVVSQINNALNTYQ